LALEVFFLGTAMGVFLRRLVVGAPMGARLARLAGTERKD
jgi:hypothetical protein